MKTVLFSGVAAAGLLLAATQADASDSSRLGSEASAADKLQFVANGRKAVGGFKPGGHVRFLPRPGFYGIPKYDVYRRPHRGFILPRYWIQPTFYLYNFRNYGLTAPASGYQWSRYYDDAVLMDNRGYVQDYRSGIDWDGDYNAAPEHEGPDRTGDYREPEYGPSMRPDGTAYNWNDDVVFAAPDGSSYSYDGKWDGEYVDPKGKVFEGDWSGTVTRHDGVDGPGDPPLRPKAAPHPEPRYEREQHHSGYHVPRGYEGYERCLKSNGVTGGAIGAILGGVAGNRIAGRGDRLGGTLLGAGLGGLAGVAVEKAMDSCKRHRPGYVDRPRGHYTVPQHGNQYWQGGYYYYPQAPQVTVTVTPGVSHTTTTVTEEVYYETVKTYPRKKAIRKWKPKPKPRCVCR
jgi:Ni/Co efflux regulator RcnB